MTNQGAIGKLSAVKYERGEALGEVVLRVFVGIDGNWTTSWMFPCPNDEFLRRSTDDFMQVVAYFVDDDSGESAFEIASQS